MHWFQSLDIELFRFINSTLMNPLLDRLMPFFSGNALFAPAVALAALLLLWKGRARGLVCLVLLALVLALGDGLVCNTLKHAIGRERPFTSLPDVHCLVGKGGSASMPSSHAANCFAAAMVLFIFYRRSLYWMLPLALVVSFSRVYNGVHYPSDVLVGAILGAGYAAALVWSLAALWRWAGQKWFPLWWERMPSLLEPEFRPVAAAEQEEADAPFALPSSSKARLGPAPRLSATAAQHPAPPKTRGQAPAGFQAPHATLDEHWLRLGYVCVALLLVARWAYLASSLIQLCEDEAYQWVWSKHLALSYYSKPPLIAYTQALGTFLWGDTAFGVRFFSPLIGALLGWMVLRFFAREVNARAGFFLLLIVTATPLLAVGSVLMTVDPLSVLFWSAAMFSGWRAVQANGSTRQWLWVGLWMGLGFLSKYTALLQWLCWAVFFLLWAPARKHLRRPGPYLALLLNGLCSLPVLIWNAQHHWITVRHVAEDASAGSAWKFTLRFLVDFIGSELGLLNPVFFIATLWAAVALWRRNRHNPRLVYFFSMGAPVVLVYLLQSFRSRILPNWIAPSVLPLFCMMVIFWDARLRLGSRQVKLWLSTGLTLGFLLVLLCHDTNLVRRISGRYLPVRLDPLHRVRQWDATAQTVEQVRQELLAEGKPVFIIADHYGMTGQLSFYLPEARAHIREEPLVYCRVGERPDNQFFFWPGYTERKGQNAIFVRELGRTEPTPEVAPTQLTQQFESVTDLGVRNVMYHDQFLLRPLQFFACRGLR